MKMVIDVLTVCLPLLYFSTVWAYAKAFFKDSIAARQVKTLMLLFTLAAHAVYLLSRTLLFNEWRRITQTSWSSQAPISCGKAELLRAASILYLPFSRPFPFFSPNVRARPRANSFRSAFDRRASG